MRTRSAAVTGLAGAKAEVTRLRLGLEGTRAFQKTPYVEISRARDRAELVTDDREELRERLEAVTGVRVAARRFRKFVRSG